MMTETEIVKKSGMVQCTVHTILKRNLSNMKYEQLTKRVRLYDYTTLPDKLKEAIKRNDTTI